MKFAEDIIPLVSSEVFSKLCDFSDPTGLFKMEFKLWFPTFWGGSLKLHYWLEKISQMIFFFSEKFPFQNLCFFTQTKGVKYTNRVVKKETDIKNSKLTKRKTTTVLKFL